MAGAGIHPARPRPRKPRSDDLASQRAHGKLAPNLVECAPVDPIVGQPQSLHRDGRPEAAMRAEKYLVDNGQTVEQLFHAGFPVGKIGGRGTDLR